MLYKDMILATSVAVIGVITAVLAAPVSQNNDFGKSIVFCVHVCNAQRSRTSRVVQRGLAGTIKPLSDQKHSVFVGRVGKENKTIVDFLHKIVQTESQTRKPCIQP